MFVSTNVCLYCSALVLLSSDDKHDDYSEKLVQVCCAVPCCGEALYTVPFAESARYRAHCANMGFPGADARSKVPQAENSTLCSVRRKQWSCTVI